MAQVHRLGAGVVQLHPVAALFSVGRRHRVGGGEHLVDKDVGIVDGPHVAVRVRHALGVVGPARRRQLVHGPVVRVGHPAVGDVLADVGHRDPVHQLARPGGQHDGLPLARQRKVGMGDAVCLHLVFAGAEHDIVLAGLDHRALGEEPFEGLLLVVGHGQLAQVDGGGAGVVQLHPVGEVVVLVPQAGLGHGHHFVDHQGVRLQGEVGQIIEMPVLGLFIAGGVLVGLDPAGGGALVAFVRVQRRHRDLVQARAVLVKQEDRAAQAGQLELGVQGARGIVPVHLVAENDDPLAGVQGNVRKEELDLVGAVGKADVFHVDRRFRRVLDFHPVAEGAVFIRQGAGVVRHDFRQHQAPGIRRPALGVPRHHHGFLGQKDDQARQDHQHHRQHRQLAAVLFLYFLVVPAA